MLERPLSQPAIARERTVLVWDGTIGKMKTGVLDWLWLYGAASAGAFLDSTSRSLWW